MNLLEKKPVLREILETKITRTPAGDAVPLDSFLDATHAEALYRQIRMQRPLIAVEVGMANAISTLAILTALEDNGGAGQLVSIDPNQSTQWRDCGRAAVARAGLAARHRVVEKPDSLALPELLAAGTRVDFGYIDGWHTFDYALVDFWYLDKMVRKDGVIAFNDCGWPAVAARSGGMEEMLRDDGAGLLVPPGAPVALADAICRLLDDAGLRAGLATGARERILTRYAPVVVGPLQEALYAEAIARWRAA